MPYSSLSPCGVECQWSNAAESDARPGAPRARLTGPRQYSDAPPAPPRQGGRILLDGRDLSDVNLRALHDQCALPTPSHTVPTVEFGGHLPT
jgi:hypothetical protein